ncbi:MAG TPA: fatty acid desaturase, partial [Ktedonosporobacter sp.]|nr:fatty acid desaturase [Ktedonosporobacter sp.]
MINRRFMSHFRLPSHATNDALPNEQSADPNACTPRQASTLPRATVTTSAPQAAHEYAELKHLIQQHGLLEKQPLYYAFKMALLLSLFVLGIIFLILVRPLWLQLLNAVYLALVTTQLGLLGHDAGHRQIFRKTWKNDLVGLLTGNLLIGMSNGWWIEKHNRHHSHPNQQDLDPDLYVPIISMT